MIFNITMEHPWRDSIKETGLRAIKHHESIETKGMPKTKNLNTVKSIEQ